MCARMHVCVYVDIDIDGENFVMINETMAEITRAPTPFAKYICHVYNQN